MLLTVALQSHLELWLGIVAANLPMMNPVMAKIVSPVVISAKSWASRSFSSSQGFSSKQECLGSSAFSSRVRKKFSHIPEGNRSMEIPMIGMEPNGIRRDVEVNVTSEDSPNSQRSRHGEV
jgi:hypothetical protein